MAVKRVVTNIGPVRPAEAKAFYGDILGMEIVMDHGWIVTFAANTRSRPEVSFAVEGGSGTPVPDLSIEVDDLDVVLEALAAADIAIEYGPAHEPWGVRRVYVRDPFGRLVNILAHADRGD
ncbi:VOC family protein [Mesorhizobium sp. BR1-1-16]|uniref:VOC family protein n=1 Tax=Mesorhizobium sp. BR1-1-16 TaxID=2876653 RepID=UPI001CD02958|nr:VOC family protein [Mesorhizobium sp. BR1-1-16]MBZ9936692.1 VOC family protein [Mesorhizobium sp. BR1-1-16]